MQPPCRSDRWVTGLVACAAAARGGSGGGGGSARGRDRRERRRHGEKRAAAGTQRRRCRRPSCARGGKGELARRVVSVSAARRARCAPEARRCAATLGGARRATARQVFLRAWAGCVRDAPLAGPRRHGDATRAPRAFRSGDAQTAGRPAASGTKGRASARQQGGGGGRRGGSSSGGPDGAMRVGASKAPRAQRQCGRDGSAAARAQRRRAAGRTVRACWRPAAAAGRVSEPPNQAPEHTVSTLTCHVVLTVQRKPMTRFSRADALSVPTAVSATPMRALLLGRMYVRRAAVRAPRRCPRARAAAGTPAHRGHAAARRCGVS
jgi:hypothetical protein